MKKYLVLITAVLVVLTLVLTISYGCATPAGANGAEPSYGEATVDGDISEWDLEADFFAEMYRAGSLDKPIESQLYLRYCCEAKTLYALVLAEPDLQLQVNGSEEHWVKLDHVLRVDDTNRPPDNDPPDFEWYSLSGDSSTALGWEASMSIETGNYLLEAHTLAFDDMEVQTSASEALTLTLDCGPTDAQLSSLTASPSEEGEPLTETVAKAAAAIGLTAFYIVFMSRKRG